MDSEIGPAQTSAIRVVRGIKAKNWRPPINDAIKNMFASRGKLYLITDSGMHTVTNNGLEPSNWPQERFSGPIDCLADDFKAFFFDEVKDLVGNCAIYSQDREDLKEAIHIMLLEGLMRAFAELQTIRANKNRRLARLDRDRPYENFVRTLWHGYRHLFPKVIGLLGYDISFLFEADPKFEKKLQLFLAQNAKYLICADIGGFLKIQRAMWQNELSLFRNDYLEHRKEEVAAIVGQFYDPDWAESVFNAVWRTIAELLSMFLESRFTPNISIRRISDERRRPERLRMWELQLCAPMERSAFTKVEVK